MASAETKHTAGPWVVDLNDDRFIVRDANDDIVADCWNGTIADDGEVPLDTCEPNARLIAAAPELLEAARLLPTDWLESGVLQSPATDKIRIELRIDGTTYESEIAVGELREAAAAIAKAEGR